MRRLSSTPARSKSDGADGVALPGKIDPVEEDD
jgi:hypothetical protein